MIPDDPEELLKFCDSDSAVVRNYFNDTANWRDVEEHYRNWNSSVKRYEPNCMKYMAMTLKKEKALLGDTEIIIFHILYAIISALGAFGNGLVIFVILWNRTMRVNRNMFILNLAISNFSLSLILFPFLWLPSTEFRYPYGEFLCKFANAFPGVNIYCSTLTITVMSIDRYYKAKDTSTVNRITDINRTRRNLMSIATAILVWLLAFFFSTPLLIFFQYLTMPHEKWEDIPTFPHGERRNFAWKVCSLSGSSGSETQKVFLLVSIMQISFLYVIPLGVLLFFNLRLIQFLARNTLQRFASKLSAHRGDEEQNAVPTTTSSQRRRARTPSALIASARRRNRTTFLLMAMAGSYAILWFPYTIYTLLTDIEAVPLNHTVNTCVRVVSMISICVNPFLYGYLNTNFKREFKIIFSKLHLCCRVQFPPHPAVTVTVNGTTPVIVTTAPSLRRAFDRTLAINSARKHSHISSAISNDTEQLGMTRIGNGCPETSGTRLTVSIADDEYSSVFIPNDFETDSATSDYNCVVFSPTN